MKIILALVSALAVACSPQVKTEATGIKFYRCPMHTWITSDKPGKCTICGMDLVPVREGDDPKMAAPGLVTLMPSSSQILGVATAPVRKGALEKTIRLSGVIDDDDTRHTIISAFFDGRIDKVFVDHVGEDIKMDQSLARIYSPELLYVVKEFQASVRRGQQDPMAAIDRKRLVQFGLTPAEVERLAGNSKDGFGIDLRSPMDGTLVTRNVYPGKYVKAGDVLFEIADYGVMWFHAKVYEQDLVWIETGAKALVTTPAAPGREFEGTVTLIDPSFDPATRSTQIRVEVPNPVTGSASGWERLLPHRAYGEARIATKKDGVLVVPRTAILDTGSRTVAYVDEGGGNYRRRDVTIGWRGDEDIEVLSGLAEGDMVVTQGNLMIDAEAQIAHADPVHPSTDDARSAGAASDPADQNRIGALSDSAAALSHDDLAAFNATAPAWGLAKPATSLAEARAAFYKAVTPAVDEVLRQPESKFKVYECPMAGSAFPGAPQKMRWIQREGPLRNPWLGEKMSECGEEVAR